MDKVFKQFMDKLNSYNLNFIISKEDRVDRGYFKEYSFRLNMANCDSFEVCIYEGIDYGGVRITVSDREDYSVEYDLTTVRDSIAFWSRMVKGKVRDVNYHIIDWRINNEEDLYSFIRI